MIYKYLTVNAAKEVIKSRKLKASSIICFNDPFEMLPTETASVSERAKSIVNEYVKNMDIKINYDLITKDEILTSKRIEKYKNERQNTMVICFSRSESEILMWSHYADQHKGIVLSFDEKEMFEDIIPKNLIKVNFADIKYCQRRPSGVSAEYMLENKFISDITTKGKFWSYEEEIRIAFNYDASAKHIAINDEQNAFIRFNPKSLKGAYFGCRNDINESDPHFMELLDEYKHLKLYQLRTSPDSYSLNIESCIMAPANLTKDPSTWKFIGNTFRNF